MNLINTKKPFILDIILFVCFGFSYWLSRYALLGLHGMKQWPNVLALIGLIIIVISIIFRNRIIPIATVLGYLGGFILAMIFNTDGVDQGGGRTNNAWQIWGIVFILSILIGAILKFIRKMAVEKLNN